MDVNGPRARVGARLSRPRFEVRLHDAAETDLVDIAAWYAERHPRGHERFLTAFREARDVLATFPFAGRARPEIHDRVRSLPVHPFVMFYVVDEAAKRLTIARVLHGHRDLAPDEAGDDD